MSRRVALVIAAALALSGCSTQSPSPASDYCVPRVSVTPAEVRPGDTITVVVESGCDAPMPLGGWVVMAAPVGELDRAVRTTVEEDLGDGLTVSIELPSSFPLGEAWAGLDGWDYGDCADNASCASPTDSFRVVRAP